MRDWSRRRIYNMDIVCSTFMFFGYESWLRKTGFDAGLRTRLRAATEAVHDIPLCLGGPLLSGK